MCIYYLNLLSKNIKLFINTDLIQLEKDLTQKPKVLGLKLNFIKKSPLIFIYVLIFII